jgi:hypothetical protein
MKKQKRVNYRYLKGARQYYGEPEKKLRFLSCTHAAAWPHVIQTKPSGNTYLSPHLQTDEELDYLSINVLQVRALDKFLLFVLDDKEWKRGRRKCLSECSDIIPYLAATQFSLISFRRH